MAKKKQQASVGGERFITVINCIDGGAQKPVQKLLNQLFGGRRQGVFHDTVTIAGGGAMATDSSVGAGINVSRHHHKSNVIVVATHDGCAGSPGTTDEQRERAIVAARTLQEAHPDADVRGVHVTEGSRKGRRGWRARQVYP